METIKRIAAGFFIAVVFHSCACGSMSSSGDSGSDPYGDFIQVEYTDSVMLWDGPICGNGIVEEGEECDDGHRRDCDGCSMNCRIELFECGTPDAVSDGDAAQEAQPPPAPEPIGETTVVSDPSDNPGDNGAGDVLHVLWTSSYFSIVYFRSCLADSPAGQCLGMRRFDESGRVIYLSTTNGEGLESAEVLVQELAGNYFSCCQIPFDSAWTGSELGVVMALPRSDPERMSCDFLLRMYLP